jgi:hypothetical protein
MGASTGLGSAGHACLWRWGFAGLALLLGLLGCEQLDPVHAIDFCADGDVISANCLQCRTPPFALRCSQCQGSGMDPNCVNGGPDAPSAAGSVIGNGGVSAAPSGGSGQGAQAASGGGGVRTGGVPGGMSAAGAPVAVSGAGAPASGGGAPMSGAGAPAPVPDACGSKCQLPFKACWAKEGTCVECVLASDCGMGTCDVMRHRCTECTANADCKSHACDTDAQKCVDCRTDDQCMANPVLDVCNSLHKCVDCDTTHGCKDASKPACFNEACVACVADSHCRDPNNRKCLVQNHSCVECLTHSDCAAPKPACNVSTHSCVACLGDSDCNTGHCLSAEMKCVDCKADSDCSSATQAHCGSANTCTKCTNDDQCSHLQDTPVCDTDSGACVTCNDDSSCPGTACIRAQHVCSQVRVGSLSACAECEADSQCGANLKCVALTFGSASLSKHYCLYTRGALSACASAANAANRPYSRTLSAVTSVDGVNGAYCAPHTTCEAMLDASTRNCTTTNDCGISGVDDGVCNGANRCTYTCNADVDCPKNGLSVCTAGLCSQPP